MDNQLEYLWSLSKPRRDAVAKQLVFDCAMELEYRAQNIPDIVLANTLMNAFRALDKDVE